MSHNSQTIIWLLGVLLLKKQQKGNKWSDADQDVAESKQDIIAYRIYDFINVTNIEQGEEYEHEHQRIYELVKYQWASEKKSQNKRLPEIQDFFDK